jgi:N-glycosylase/DNA lyase
MHSLTLQEDQPLSLDITLSCGQVFRWQKADNGWWQGIVGDRMIRIRQDGRTLRYTGAGRGFIEHYFALEQDLPLIVSSFDNDPFIHAARERCTGLRLIRQPPWECLISYICATNSNIPMIRTRIENIAQRFGNPLGTGIKPGYGFPEPSSIAGCCDAVLSECKMGYRGPYVRKTACSISDPDEWAQRISSLPFADARRELMQLQGVGPKAADCILLFAFQKYEAFPVDVWIRRIMRENYLPHLSDRGALTAREYDAIRVFGREHFGPYCGYAQEYLYAAREVI